MLGRRPLLSALFALALAVPALGQEAASAPSSPKYENPELGIIFSGVYGWSSHFATASGAWTELARYDSDAQNDSFVSLSVRDNPYETLPEMRRAIEAEFKESSAAPAPGRPAYKEVSVREVQMKRGIDLPGIEVEAMAVEIGEDGKSRERLLLVRTYYGENRLYRVFCSARRARAKKVRDLLERAVGGLTVSAVEEKTSRGVHFRSIQGSYSCMVPEGFSVVRPPDAWVADAKFENGRAGIVISVISAAYGGITADQIEELRDYYGNDLTIEEADVMGSDGFNGTVKKPDSVTLITGLVREGRVYRVHTASAPKAAEAAKRVHADFLKTLKLGRQS